MSNEAAERLRHGLPWRVDSATFDANLDAALAAERKATVERIRAAVVGKSGAYDWTADEAAVGAEVHDTLFAILDAEAARG